jgi:hypothetical protein
MTGARLWATPVGQVTRSPRVTDCFCDGLGDFACTEDSDVATVPVLAVHHRTQILDISSSISC